MVAFQKVSRNASQSLYYSINIAPLSNQREEQSRSSRREWAIEDLNLRLLPHVNGTGKKGEKGVMDQDISSILTEILLYINLIFPLK